MLIAAWPVPQPRNYYIKAKERTARRFRHIRYDHGATVEPPGTFLSPCPNATPKRKRDGRAAQHIGYGHGFGITLLPSSKVDSITLHRRSSSSLSMSNTKQNFTIYRKRYQDLSIRNIAVGWTARSRADDPFSLNVMNPSRPFSPRLLETNQDISDFQRNDLLLH